MEFRKSFIFDPCAIFFIKAAKGFIIALSCLGVVICFVPNAWSDVISETTHGTEVHSLDGEISNTDLLAGLIATELPGDQGWHPANGLPADRLPAFTDGTGMLASGLTGLLNDFPGAGVPAKSIQYDLGSLMDIAEIQILSGSNGKDGRIFSTTVIYWSSNGTSFNLLGYFQSDPSGTINNSFSPSPYGSTLVEIYNDSSPTLLSASYLRFDFYAVDNAGGQMRDPFDGINPFTGVDDGITAAYVSPLILEIDVIGVGTAPVPEPTTMLLLSSGLIGLLGYGRRKFFKK